MCVFRRYPVFFVMLVTALLLETAPQAAAQPHDKCAQERAIAESRYLQGQFDEAVVVLQQCLDREELFVDEAVQVYRLISLIHLNTGEVERAQQAIHDLLRQAPAYQADPIQDPPSYTTMVAVIRQELEAQAQASKPLPTPEEELEEERQEQPSASQNQPEARPEPPPRSDEPVVIPMVVRPQPTRQRSILRTPRSWLLATGGAVVIATAVALVLGGSAESSPAPPR